MTGFMASAKKYILLLMCVFVLQAKAQIKHAIYIQAEDKKPFYVTVNGHAKNSTESGYIILSQITDTLYPVIIGSASNDFPEQKFVVNINNSDWEFSFRKRADNEYELLDMIHSTVLNIYKESVVKAAEVAVVPPPVQDSAQQKINVKADTLAVVVKDTPAIASNYVQDSAQQKSVAIIEPDTIVAKPEVVKDTIAATQIQQVNGKKEGGAVVPPASKIQSSIQPATGYYKVSKIFERVSPQGVDLIYVDERKPKFDTIAIFIPAAIQGAIESERLKKVAEPVKPKPVTITPTPEQKTVAPVVTKQRCTNIASDDDFLSLRKQMASANNEEEMLATAKNSFAGKCFSVAQIKNLSVLFLNEKNKFGFFQIAKPAASDSKDFYKLINQFTQPDLIEKFAALIQQ